MNLNKKLILFSTLTTVISMILLTLAVTTAIKTYQREQIKQELEQSNKVVSDYCSYTNSIDYNPQIGNLSNYIMIYIIGDEQINILANDFENNLANDIFVDELTTIPLNQIYELKAENRLLMIYTNKVIIDNNYYTIATAMYDEDILQITHKITIYVAILSLATCIIIIALFSLVVNKLTSPFKPILEGVKNFSQKRFEQTIEVDTNDEFKYLAQEMNKMAQKLKQLDIKEKKFYEDYSHDIKTPLTVISSYIQGLRTGIITDCDKTYFLVEEECSRLKKYIENMIYLSKLETIDNSNNSETIEINQLLSESLIQLDSLIILSDLDIEFEALSKIYVKGNKEQLQRAFVNIFSNGIKYSKNIISVDCQETKDIVKITIIDDGNGFSPEVLENPFSRRNTGEHHGSGIGLSIVNKIISMHGGTLALSNIKNKGACYIVILPKFCHK